MRDSINKMAERYILVVADASIDLEVFFQHIAKVQKDSQRDGEQIKFRMGDLRITIEKQSMRERSVLTPNAIRSTRLICLVYSSNKPSTLQHLNKIYRT